jgi:hypothetical protein
MAYEFILRNKLTFQNLKAAHAILIANLLPTSQQGLLRTNPMIVINWEDRIDDVVAENQVNWMLNFINCLPILNFYWRLI